MLILMVNSVQSLQGSLQLLSVHSATFVPFWEAWESFFGQQQCTIPRAQLQLLQSARATAFTSTCLV